MPRSASAGWIPAKAMGGKTLWKFAVCCAPERRPFKAGVHEVYGCLRLIHVSSIDFGSFFGHALSSRMLISGLHFPIQVVRVTGTGSYDLDCKQDVASSD